MSKISHRDYVNLSDAKLSLYSVPWQVLRVSFLGSWLDVPGTQDNLRRLKYYISTGKVKGVRNLGIDLRDGHTKRTRVWRALNLLNAVRMGFSGQGRFDSPQSKLVEDFRDQLSVIHSEANARRLEYSIDRPDTISLDWNRVPIGWRNKVLNNLTGRLSKHADSAFRDELRWFIDIVNGAYDVSGELS